MKTLIISTIVAAFSINAFATSIDWREIESKKCDESAAVAVQDESVGVALGETLLAFKKKDETGCNYADFYTVLKLDGVSSNLPNVLNFSVLQPQQAYARKNCRNEMSAAPAVFFTLAMVTENKISLHEANGCRILELNLKPKAVSSQPATE